MIGLQEIRKELFEDIPWGTHRVLGDTLTRARAAGVEFDQLNKIKDIDTAGDLWFVAQRFEALQRFLK